MAYAIKKKLGVDTGVRTKIETTYEYVPIIGNILGYWRVSETMRLGDKIELHLKADLDEYDTVYINGRPIEWKYKNQELRDK